MGVLSGEFFHIYTYYEYMYQWINTATFSVPGSQLGDSCEWSWIHVLTMILVFEMISSGYGWIPIRYHLSG